MLERGENPSDWWCAHPENVCHCPSQPPENRCRCSHCLSWLRRAPRCRRADCHAYAWVHDDGLCHAHHSEVAEQRRISSAKARALRTPPRPPHEHELDTCSLCGTSPLPGRRRSWCSDACVDLWNIATTGSAALAHLVALHGHVCWGCGADEEPERRHHWSANPGELTGRMVMVRLEVEHVRPLWSLTDDERQQLRWWLPYNLQLLCVRCHKAKTSAEAAQRAAARRAG